jgi:[acyl-carrier-protein] S-malonyltransferase
LVAAGALTFEEALRLDERRAFFMEEAARLVKGTMAAVIGFDRDRLTEICRQTGTEVANFNSPEQTVITGRQEKVMEACRRIQAEGLPGQGAKSVIPLEVSGAFHSSLMQPAAQKFQGELRKISIRSCRIPVVSNVHAKPHGGPDSVRWEESVRHIASLGIADFIEIGPGKVLKGLIRRIDPSLRVFNIEKPEDMKGLPL